MTSAASVPRVQLVEVRTGRRVVEPLVPGKLHKRKPAGGRRALTVSSPTEGFRQNLTVGGREEDGNSGRRVPHPIVSPALSRPIHLPVIRTAAKVAFGPLVVWREGKLRSEAGHGPWRSMSTNDDYRLSVVPGQSDENPAGIYGELEDSIRELDAASGKATWTAVKFMEQVDPTYNRWHELYGAVGEPPDPPREVHLAYEQVKRLVKIRRAINREVVELDERLYGKAITPPEIRNKRPVSIRIRRIDTNLNGDPDPWWEARWEYDNGTGGSIQAKDKAGVLAAVAGKPAPDMQIQDPESGEWSPWTPEAGS